MQALFAKPAPIHRLVRGALLALWVGAAPWIVHAKDPAVAAKTTPSADSSKQAAVTVSDAWIRASVSGQQATGGFMDLTAAQAMTLVGFESPVAAQAELHEMAMDGDVMRMRAIDSLALPANQTVSLKPGGHHLMLMGLKKTLTAGQSVDLTLLLKSTDGKVVKHTVKVPVKAQSPMMGGGGGMHHHHHHHHH